MAPLRFTCLLLTGTCLLTACQSAPSSSPTHTASGGDVRAFENVTEAMGLTGLGTGATTWVDFDQDGYIDLYVSGQLWRNVEGKRFERVADVPLNGYGVWADLDGDGYPDVFTWNNNDGARLYRNLQGQGFERIEDALPNELPMKISRAAAWGDVNGDGFLDLVISGYESAWVGGRPPAHIYPDAILLNRGDNTFELLQALNDRQSTRGITLADYNEDGRLDIFFSKYRLLPNQLLRNDGENTFIDVSQEAQVAGNRSQPHNYYGHTIGSAWGDLDNDGHLDLFIGNFSHAPVWQDRPQFLRNLGPHGDFKFEDLSARAELHWQESYATPALGDFDNDGYLDLFFTTVYANDSSVLYRNQGDFRFHNVSAITGTTSARTYQAAWGDFDNDGHLDLVTGGRLYRNPGSSNHWLQVQLVGNQEGNREAIGAQVRVRLGRQILTRQVETATGETNRNDPRLHFGLGQHRRPVRLEIRWPDGSQQVLRTPIDRLVTIEQGKPAE